MCRVGGGGSEIEYVTLSCVVSLMSRLKVGTEMTNDQDVDSVKESERPGVVDVDFKSILWWSEFRESSRNLFYDVDSRWTEHRSRVVCRRRQ